jgi:hypothetical protein
LLKIPHGTSGGTQKNYLPAVSEAARFIGRQSGVLLLLKKDHRSSSNQGSSSNQQLSCPAASDNISKKGILSVRNTDLQITFHRGSLYEAKMVSRDQISGNCSCGFKKGERERERREREREEKGRERKRER